MNVRAIAVAEGPATSSLEPPEDRSPRPPTPIPAAGAESDTDALGSPVDVTGDAETAELLGAEADAGGAWFRVELPAGSGTPPPEGKVVPELPASVEAG